MIGEPPSDAGAVQETVACALPPSAVAPVGGSGATEGPAAGVTGFEATDGALSPTAFVATTVKVYSMPLVRPATSAFSVAPSAVVTLILSGLEVTV